MLMLYWQNSKRLLELGCRRSTEGNGGPNAPYFVTYGDYHDACTGLGACETMVYQVRER